MTSEQTNPQEYIYNLAAAPGFGETPGAACFAARSSGLYRSDDGGKTWRLATESLGLSEPVPATVVALSPDFAHDHSAFGGMAGGLLHSSDGGSTWGVATLPPPPPTVTALVVSPNFDHDGILLAGTMEDGVLCSNDRGWRWVAWNFGLLDLNIYSMAISPEFAGDETIYAGTESGIFRSTNGGRAWREVNLPSGFETTLSLAISPNYARDGALFAGTEGHGLLVSNDFGESWETVGADALDGPVNSIHLSPDFATRPELVVLSNGGALISRDCGKSWSALWEKLSAENEITALLAPQGFAPGKPAWLGLVGGEVVKVKF